jgi:hypothetical protein
MALAHNSAFSRGLLQGFHAAIGDSGLNEANFALVNYEKVAPAPGSRRVLREY